MTWIDFLNLLINGLIEGLVVALPALAMTLVMGVNRFPNAATGDMMTTGAYAAVAVQLLGGWPLWAAALGSMVVTAVVSAGSYQLIFRKLAGRPMVASMLAAIGLGFLLRSLISFFAGHDQRTFDLPLVRAWNFGGIRILPTDLAIAAVAAVVATADAYAQTVVNHLKAARFDGITSLAGCADYLNRHGVKTRRGAAFAPMTVKRLAARLGITFPRREEQRLPLKDMPG